MNMNSVLYRGGKLSVQQITRVSMCSAILFISQIALSFIPNGELVSMLTIIFTLNFGWEMIFAVTVFSLLEGTLYGFGIWVVSYLYVWPLLVVVTMLLKKYVKEDFTVWAVVSGLFGMVFGTLFSVLYIPISKTLAFNYWISGLPWDFWHCMFNFGFMWIIGRDVNRIVKRISKIRQ